MQNHLYRSLLILAVVIIGAVNVVPTVGWMTLSSEERGARTERWNTEDSERRGKDTSIFTDYGRAIKRWSEFDVDKTITLGLDLQGGIHMVMGFEMTQEALDRGLTEEDVQQIILQTVRNRIDEYEAQEPIIQALGTNQVQIQLPGERDIQRAKKLITQAAVLDFHITSGPQEAEQALEKVDIHFKNKLVPFLSAPDFISGEYRVTPENFEEVKKLLEEANTIPGLLPEGKVFVFSKAPNPWDKEPYYLIYLMEEEKSMGGENLSSASARPDQQSPGNWTILFEFNTEGANDFANLTEANVNRRLGIVLDGYMMSAPNINERIFGSGSISGTFNTEEAKDLAITLNSGSLPVKPTEDYTGIVGASLGAESVTKGVRSSLIGLGMVMVFMIVYYQAGGIIANISLAVNAIIILGAFAYFNTTLTMPGIAGLILTIGMAVDANVLIFERMREEAKNGKSLSVCIESGYERATSAILDANVTTLIAAIVLTQFGTGPVQGFAIALSIGICSSVFAALVITRALLEFLCERKIISKINMLSLISADTKIDFLGKRKMAALLSVVAILAGLGILGVRGSDFLGVDFTNGTNMQVSLVSDNEVGVEAVRNALSDAGFGGHEVQESEEAGVVDKNRFLIRISESTVPSGDAEVTEDISSESISTTVQKALLPLTSTPDTAKLDEAVILLRVETVGPAVGQQLQRDARNAIFFALFFIVLYLWFRFEWKFAVGAVVALVHDVLIVIGLMALFGRELSIPVVAALLTIIGYSLNDTIVVFDRVREDMGLNKSRGMEFLDSMNLSINRTLSRTLLTSLTTLFVVVVLFLFGGSAINDFAFALIAGVIVGTYSSIFVATPVVYAWQKWRDKQRAAHAEKVAGQKNKGGKKNRPTTA